VRLLISAFACSPRIGSEPTVGWEWSSRLAADHDVTLLTHSHFRRDLEQELAARARPRLRIEYHEVPWLKLDPELAVNSRLYYLVWQISILPRVARLVREQEFDLVQHLTWGSFRLPSFLGFVGRPFILGPVGGGERAPFKLRRSLPPKAKAFELLRDFLIWSGRFDPLLRLAISRADVILAKTRETCLALPASARQRAIVAHEIGAYGPATESGAPAAQRDELRILFAGRMIPAKGLHLALLALSRLSGDHLLRLYLAGDGPLRASLEAQAARLGVQDRVTFLGMVPRDRFLATYREMDCFLFPSLHDSSGNVVLEALANGLPVICLDLGGPKYFVDDSCAIIVGTRDRTEGEVAAGLAEAMTKLEAAPAERARLAGGALQRARELTWDHQINRAYALIERQLALTDGKRRPSTSGTRA
jgi:glycosyltransferase involved in cell wall biosynthesis